ncbi:LysE family transporter [Bacteroidota bacterium]
MPEATIPLIFITSFTVALSGALMPGPLLAITIGESVRSGFWAGPKIIMGHAILELAVVAALALGLSRFITSDLVSAIIGLAGGGILLAMGAIALKQGLGNAAMPTAEAGKAGRNGRIILSGILGSMSNPYWFIWWVTLGTVYLIWALGLGIAGVASFFTGHILADLSWYALVAFIVATGRKIMNDKVYRRLLGLCGLGLLALGIYFIVSGIIFLNG